MSFVSKWKPRPAWLALALVTGLVLGAPASQAAHVGIGINLFPPVVAPPIVVAPPAVVAAPPVVVGPPAYYVAPHRYYYARGPRHGFYWYDHNGHRYWHR
jgi:hypothetical protein